MSTSKKKRKYLLACARQGCSLLVVNQRLSDACLEPVSPQEWNLWANYYLSIVKNDPYYEKELIENNRSLAWFANEINNRRRTQIIS